MGGTFVELEPANNAVVGQIFSYSRFRDAQMLRELRFDGIDATTGRAAAKKIRDGDAEGLASFDVVVAGEIGIGEKENAGACGNGSVVVELDGIAVEQAAKLHFEQRETGRKTGIP